MLNLILDNLGTIIISLLLLTVIVSIISTLIKNKKRGITSCGCGCSTCHMNGTCHSKQ